MICLVYLYSETGRIWRRTTVLRSRQCWKITHWYVMTVSLEWGCELQCNRVGFPLNQWRQTDGIDRVSSKGQPHEILIWRREAVKIKKYGFLKRVSWRETHKSRHKVLCKANLSHQLRVGDTIYICATLLHQQ